MNLNQIKYFQAVCTYRSVSAAAKFLNISQPSLSNSIKELESEFGVILFHRHHHGMIPTPEGETLLNLSRDVLNRSENMEKVMVGLGKKRNLLKLGVPPMLGSLILPAIYGGFISSNSDIELQITPQILHQTEQVSTIQTLLSHDIAAGFMFRYPVSPDSGFVPIPLNTPIHAKVSLIRTKDTYFSDAMNKFKEHISKTNIFKKIYRDEFFGSYSLFFLNSSGDNPVSSLKTRQK